MIVLVICLCSTLAVYWIDVPGQHRPTQHPHSDAIAATYPHAPVAIALGTSSISIPSRCRMLLCTKRPGNEAVIRASSAEAEQAWVGSRAGLGAL